MDFQSAKLAGGASELVRVVEAFAGVGIVNRVVAVFDNDTAAAEAVDSLKKINLPSAVRWLQLPSAQLASSCPAISPTGNTELTNVNGLAGSIEMYFGKSILRKSDGELTPVHWRGYNEKLGRYQGELADKAGLLKKFSAKLQECLMDHRKFMPAEWIDMSSVIRAICFAFN